LPGGLRDPVKHIRIFGPRELAQPLADELELRFEPAGLKVEYVSAYAANEFGLTLPVETPVSPAFSLAARFLAESKPPFEFLPPKPNFLERLATKYSSGRLRTTGAAAAGIAALVIGLFLVQQIQLWHYRSQWSRLAAKVGELQAIQDNLHQYRSWYAGTFPNLAILRQLSLAFPEDGSVTAKSIEVRDGRTVTCSGTVTDYPALLAMQARLRAADGLVVSAAGANSRAAPAGRRGQPIGPARGFYPPPLGGHAGERAAGQHLARGATATHGGGRLVPRQRRGGDEPDAAVENGLHELSHADLPRGNVGRPRRVEPVSQ